MKPVSISIGNLVNGGGTIVSGCLQPKSLNSICPYCNAKATFTLRRLFSGVNHRVWPAVGQCPACSETVFFSFFYSGEHNEPAPVDICMFPSPSLSLPPIDLPSTLPPSLNTAIRNAEECYRAGLFSPTVSSAGRALEGIIKHFSNDFDGSLFDLINNFCKSDNVSLPIKNLAHAMRESRNVAAHFDEKIEPDQESAEVMLELLHYLISYLFLFSEKAELLSKKLK